MPPCIVDPRVSNWLGSQSNHSTQSMNMHILMPKLSSLCLHLCHYVQLQRLRKVPTLTSLLLPSFNLRQGDHPQCLSVFLRTYWCICTLNSFCSSFYPHNNLGPRKGHPSPCCTVNSSQKKFISDNLNPLSTSWHSKPISAPRTIRSNCLCPTTSSLGHVVVSTSLCLGMVRLHPQPSFPKKEKHSHPSNLFMLQFSCSHNPQNQGKSSTHLLSSSCLSTT
jgi:hypothetical protein